MIGYMLLVVLQFIAAFFGAPMVLRYIPVQGDPRTFVHAAIYAVLVWIVGLVASFALKDVRLPGPSPSGGRGSGASPGGALVLPPPFFAALPFHSPPLYLPLVGAILGYLLRR